MGTDATIADWRFTIADSINNQQSKISNSPVPDWWAVQDSNL
jgi:hypothetical protein